VRRGGATDAPLAPPRLLERPAASGKPVVAASCVQLEREWNHVVPAARLPSRARRRRRSSSAPKPSGWSGRTGPTGTSAMADAPTVQSGVVPVAGRPLSRQSGPVTPGRGFRARPSLSARYESRRAPRRRCCRPSKETSVPDACGNYHRAGSSNAWGGARRASAAVLQTADVPLGARPLCSARRRSTIIDHDGVRITVMRARRVRRRLRAHGSVRGRRGPIEGAE
jgi:hypothetical protein